MMTSDEFNQAMCEYGQLDGAQCGDNDLAWEACRLNMLEAIEEGDAASIAYYQGMFTQQPGTIRDEYGMQYTYDA